MVSFGDLFRSRWRYLWENGAHAFRSVNTISNSRSALPGLAQKSMNMWTRNVAASRTCFLLHFSSKSEATGLPKVPQGGPRVPNGLPIASPGHPKISTLPTFLQEVVQGCPRGAIWEHFGSIWDAFWEHFQEISQHKMQQLKTAPVQ